MHSADDSPFENDLRAALALDDDERAYLTQLDLSAAWRPAPERVWTTRLAWLSLAVIVAAGAAWLFTAPRAAPLAAQVVQLVSQFSASTVLVRLLLHSLWAAGESLLTLSSTPSLSFSMPLLALLGLALLAWPRSQER